MEGIGLLFKVLWSPGEAMFHLSKKPRIVVPIVFLCLFSLVTGALVMSKLDSAELAMRAIERSPQGAQMTDQQKDLLRSQMNSPIFRVFGLASTVIGPIIMILLIAGLYFALFTMLGREGGFKAFLSITAFAFIPGIFRQAAAVLSAFVMPASSIMPDELGSLSAGVFIDRDSASPVLFAAANTIDLVSIWILALLIIGYGFVTRKSLSAVTRSCAVLGVFLVYVALRLALAAVRGV